MKLRLFALLYFSSGRQISIWLFVVNFNFIFSIGQRFRAGSYKISHLQQYLPVSGQLEDPTPITAIKRPLKERMAKIQIQPDCGNAPRKLFLKNLNIAIANGDLNYVNTVIPKEIVLDIVGHKRINGKEDYLTELANYQLWQAEQLIIDTIITHGAEASVSGQIITKDNNKFAFSDIYRFKGAGGATIKVVRSFIIKV